MIDQPGFEDARVQRALPEILENLGRAPAPDYADRILGTTVRTRQRPSWTFPEGWIPGRFATAGARSASLSWRPVVVLALLLVSVAAASVLVAGAPRPKVPPPFGPARNGDIAFGMAGDIFKIIPASGVVQRLTSSLSNDWAPLWAPDGRHAAFGREPWVQGNQPVLIDVFVMDADGTGDHRVNVEPMPDPPNWYEWAPDSRTLLVITSDRADAVMETFDSTQIGQPTVLVTPGIQPQQVWFQPPDGQRLLVRGKQGFKVGLWTMNRDGSEVRAVVEPYETGLPDDLFGASWSPDGTQVLYQRGREADGGQRLYIANADGSAAREVASGAGGVSHEWAHWSPDGTRILFHRLLRAETISTAPRFQFAVLDLTDDRVVDSGSEMEGWADAAWAPDGTQIVVVPTTGELEPALLLDPAGGPARNAGWDSDQLGGWQRTAP